MNWSQGLFLVAVVFVALSLAGCGKPATDSAPVDSEATATEPEQKLTPEERRYLDAAQPFAAAIATRRYADAFALLSTHAVARMSLNQFAAETDDAKFEALEQKPVTNVTADKFAELMKRAEDLFGMPERLKDLNVFSTKAAVLTRSGTELEDKVDALFAIGNMPDSVPNEIRRASLRGQVRTKLSPAELEKLAKEAGQTVAELEKELEPYFTIKIVLVEEAGALKVGYFELLPPGIMD